MAAAAAKVPGAQGAQYQAAAGLARPAAHAAQPIAPEAAAYLPAAHATHALAAATE